MLSFDRSELSRVAGQVTRPRATNLLMAVGVVIVALLGVLMGFAATLSLTWPDPDAEGGGAPLLYLLLALICLLAAAVMTRSLVRGHRVEAGATVDETPIPDVLVEPKDSNSWR